MQHPYWFYFKILLNVCHQYVVMNLLNHTLFTLAMIYINTQIRYEIISD